MMHLFRRGYLHRRWIVLLRRSWWRRRWRFCTHSANQLPLRPGMAAALLHNEALGPIKAPCKAQIRACVVQDELCD